MTFGHLLQHVKFRQTGQRTCCHEHQRHASRCQQLRRTCKQETTALLPR